MKGLKYRGFSKTVMSISKKRRTNEKSGANTVINKKE